MTQTLSQTEEQRFLGHVKRAVSLCEGGLSPDDAIEKVAREEKYPPGYIRTMSHAFNTGRQLHQWEEGGSVLDKLASFPLADADAVIARIFGTAAAKEAAAPLPPDTDYLMPPTWADPVREKIARAPMPSHGLPPAEPYAPDPAVAFHRADAAIAREKRAVDDLRRKLSDLEDDVRTASARLVGYFKQASYYRLPFAVVESAANSYIGRFAKPLLDVAYSQAKLNEKRASAEPPQLTTPLNLNAAPFTFIRECVKKAEDAHTARQNLAAGREKAAQVERESLRPFTGTTPPQPRATSSSPARGNSSSSEKAASILGSPAVGAAVGTMLGRSMGSVPKTKDDLIEDAWLDLEDPSHMNELRRIKANAMLNSMLTDPEDPISGYDPDRVLQAYNEIASLTPRLAEQSAALRPALRRRLEGHTEPFEIKELTDVEKGLTATRTTTPNTSLLGDASSSLLG